MDLESEKKIRDELENKLRSLDNERNQLVNNILMARGRVEALEAIAKQEEEDKAIPAEED